MDQPTFHLRALKSDRSLTDAAVRMKRGSVAEAAKAIGVTRQQLYNVINGRSSITPEMAVRFERAFGGGANMWLRMQAAHDLANVRQSREKITVRRLARPA